MPVPHRLTENVDVPAEPGMERIPDGTDIDQSGLGLRSSTTTSGGINRWTTGRRRRYTSKERRRADGERRSVSSRIPLNLWEGGCGTKQNAREEATVGKISTVGSSEGSPFFGLDNGVHYIHRPLS